MLLSGCESKQNTIKSLEDMKGRKIVIGVPDDIDARPYLHELCPDAKYVSQNDSLYGVQSVAEGKTDAFVVGRYFIEKIIREAGIKNVVMLDDPLITYQCALGLSLLCKIPDYENTVNESMRRMLADGTLEEMKDRWFGQKDETMPDIQLDENAEYTLNAVTYGQARPYSYYSDGRLVGFDVELLYRLCEENHWGLKLSQAEYPSMLMGLATGKYDMISANLYVTQNRDENVTFAIPYERQDICVVVRGESAPADADALEFSSIDELKSAKSIAVMTGTPFDDYVREFFPQAEVLYFQNMVDCTLAVTSGKADAAIQDAPTIQCIVASTKGVGLVPEYLAEDSYHFILPRSERGKRLRDEFNDWLDEQKRNGNLEKMRDFWMSDKQPEEIPDFNALPDTNGTIRVIMNPACRPDTYMYNNKPVGYPSEIIYRFLRDRGYAAEVSILEFDSTIPAIVTEKADIAVGFISHTEERAENVLFTDTVLDGGIGLLVRTAEKADGDAGNRFLSRLKKTFVTENRWKLILSGLGVTFFITLGGFALANLLGAVFCACAMSKRKGLRMIADVNDRIMQGTPMVVILMILYYVIFGKTSISGIWVSIIAFGFVSGASLARQFRGAIMGVDRGQTEAALSIGFTRFEAFAGIVFPQAARTALPGYFSEIIGLMKGTAVVGYVAVIDLTRSGDLIRSSTYDAFFPLLSIALIYFVISFGILSLLKRIQKKLAPKRVGAQEAAK